MTVSAWEEAFLDALAACGVASEAAAAAGIGVRNAFKRRKNCATFAKAWAAAAELHRSEQARRALGGAEMLVVQRKGGGKLVRAGQNRWSKRGDEAFLTELAASASVRRAAAAGFSTQAIYRQRRSSQAFGEKWDEAIAIGRTRIEAYLIESADRTLDPVGEDGDHDLPRMTVAEAIQVLKVTARPTKAKQEEAWDSDFQMGEESESDLRARIIDQLDRLREQDEERRREEEAAGAMLAIGPPEPDRPYWDDDPCGPAIRRP